MEIPRHWRLKQQRLALVGEVEEIDGNRVYTFPPRTPHEDLSLAWIRARDKELAEPKVLRKFAELETYWEGASERAEQAEAERQERLAEQNGIELALPFMMALNSVGSE